MVDSTTKNRTKGKAQELKGKVKEIAGRASGNDRLEASGRADRAEGKGRTKLGEAGDKVKRVASKITGKG